MTRIYSDENERFVNAISREGDNDTNGRFYQMHFGDQVVELRFQSKNPTEGVDGITNEMLYAVLEHRLQALNSRMPCEENEVALGCIRAARMAQEQRQSRLQQG